MTQNDKGLLKKNKTTKEIVRYCIWKKEL